jgi:xylulokinase
VGARLIATASSPIGTTHPGPGLAEQDPASWLAAVAIATGEVLAAVGIDGVDAIALTAQSDSLVVVDEDGQTIGPSLLWMDERGKDEAARFERDLGRAEIHRRTGLRSAPNFTGAKAAWVRSADPLRLAGDMDAAAEGLRAPSTDRPPRDRSVERVADPPLRPGCG